jgi:hypothetical protein
MHFKLLPSVVVILTLAHPLPGRAFPDLLTGPFSGAGVPSLVSSSELRSRSVEKRANFDSNRNGSTFLWLLQDTYAGKTFFESVITTIKCTSI